MPIDANPPVNALPPSEARTLTALVDDIRPAFPENNIAVFFGCDDKYFAYTMAAIASLLARASPAANYDLLVLQQGVAADKVAGALDWMRRFPNASLRCIDMGVLMERVGREKFALRRWLSPATYYRLFAAEVFAAYDKIAYFDADIVFLSDVAEFFRLDMRGNPILACHDLVMENDSRLDPEKAAYWRDRLGFGPDDGYFNAGVLLMDLSAMRRDGVPARLLDTLANFQDPLHMDQDIMNRTFRGRATFTAGVWNCMDCMYDDEEKSSFYITLDGRFLEQARAARRGAKFLHFAEQKPWSWRYQGRNADIFWRQAAESPLYDEIVARLRAECSGLRLPARYLGALLQSGNFTLRLWLSGAERRQRNLARLRNLALRRRTLAKLMFDPPLARVTPPSAQANPARPTR